jgi:hypothetical protein
MTYRISLGNLALIVPNGVAFAIGIATVLVALSPPNAVAVDQPNLRSAECAAWKPHIP